MRLARRAFLGFAVLSAMADPVSAKAPDESLDYRDGVLRWPDGSARAAVGRTGVSANKKEGDGATPAGRFPLALAFYRADRMSAPSSGLPLRALSPSDGWVNDPPDQTTTGSSRCPTPATPSRCGSTTRSTISWS